MRRPEDQLADEMLAACGALPGVVVIDLRKVGLFAPVFRDRKTKLTTYGPPVRIGEVGQPDFLFLVDGKGLGIELKSDAAHGRFAGDVDRLLPEQVTAHRAWERMGTPVRVCRSVEAVREAIEARRCS